VIFTWIISSLIAGEVVLFLAMLWFRDRHDVALYPPGWFYFALTLGMFVSANTSLYAYQDTLNRMEILRTIIARRLEVNSLMRSVFEMESGQRGYLITGKPAYLEPYKRSERELAARIEAVRSIYAGLPDEPYADAMAKTASMKAREMADVLETYHSADRGKAIEIVQTDTGKNLMDLCREAYDDLLRRNLYDYERERQGVAMVAMARIIMAVMLIIGSIVQMVLGAYRGRVFHRHEPGEPDVADAVKAISGLDLPKPDPRA
jgi:CHASE3 domain sensor protein